MENDASNNDKNGHTAPDTAPVSSSRRRLVLTTAPILLAVANRPAWANMCSISGAMSGPHSGATAVTACLGCTPGFWKANPKAWPLAYPGFEDTGIEDPLTGECSQTNGNTNGNSTCKLWDNTGTTFDDVFGVGSALALKLPPEDYFDGADITLMNLLWAGTKNNATMAEVAGAHICAGLFNAGSFAEEYGYNVPLFITMVQNALMGTYPTGILPPSVEGFKNMLDTMNNRGCPLSASGK